MGLGTLFADELSDLELTQAIDDQWPDDQSGEERCETRESGAKREKTKYSERRKIMKEF